MREKKTKKHKRAKDIELLPQLTDELAASLSDSERLKQEVAGAWRDLSSELIYVYATIWGFRNGHFKQPIEEALRRRSEMISVKYDVLCTRAALAVLKGATGFGNDALFVVWMWPQASRVIRNAITVVAAAEQGNIADLLDFPDDLAAFTDSITDIVFTGKDPSGFFRPAEMEE